MLDETYLNENIQNCNIKLTANYFFKLLNYDTMFKYEPIRVWKSPE